MNNSTLAFLKDHFDIAFAAPDGIKKLRALILTLAMQGKLVPQDPKDQPASELLKEIEAEKKRLVKEGKIKKQKPLPPIKPEEIPYAVPEGWVWVRLATSGVTQTGTTPPKKDSGNFGNFIPFIGPGNIKKHEIDYTGEGLSDIGLSRGRLIPANSIMMVCIGGSIGKQAINEIDVACNQQINAITTFTSVDVKYLFYVMESSAFQNIVLNQAGGSATPIINKQKWSSIPVPLPSHSEQKRIVAKIDQLMALCDKLESERNERNQKRLTVHSAAMNRLLTAPDKTDLDKSWHFITRHFGELYSVPQNMAELKKAILQLAVMGKLVPQDPKDQPASELLKEIEAEKKQLVKERKIKKSEPLPPIKSDEMPYEVPKGWVWCYLDDLCLLITDGTHQTPKYTQTGVPFLSVKNLSSGYIDFSDTKFISVDEHKELIKRCKPEKNDILLTKVGTTGIAVIVNTDKEFSIFVSVALLKLIDKFLFPEFITRLINSPLVKKYSADGTEGVGNKNLVLRKIKAFVIPLPPLAEQKRIVTKIDQLMALCDTLNKQISSATEKQTAILNAVLVKV